MRIVLIAVAALLLSACQQQSKPQPLAPSAAVTAAETSSRVEQQVQSQQKQMAGLEQRLTLVQEQVIKSNQNLAQLQQRAQQQLVALQQLQMLMAAQPSDDESGDSGALEQLVLLVDRLEQMSTSSAATSKAPPSATPGPHYKLVSAYTAKGQWVIFKYDEVTGLTWNAADGRWVEVDESEVMLASRYQVVLRPATLDVKGYVAARIDHQSGRTWWLNGSRWEPFQ